MTEYKHEHHFECKPVIQVPVIVNSNTAQVLVVEEIPLTPPAFKISEIHKLIEIDECATGCDKVIINGRLVKNIVYKTKGKCDVHHRCCHDIHEVCGDMKHCTVEIPFHLFVDVKGTRPGDMCEVEDAIVAAEFDKLIDPTCEGTFKKLLEKTVIKLRVKTFRIRHLKVEAKDVTPKKLRCELEEASEVQEIPGLDIEEEIKEKFDP